MHNSKWRMVNFLKLLDTEHLNVYSASPVKQFAYSVLPHYFHPCDKMKVDKSFLQAKIINTCPV